MRIIECVQGSDAWQKARLGVPTASRFDRIITPTGKPSEQRRTYLSGLVAERLIGEPAESFENAAMMRGEALEPLAAAWYAMTSPVTTIGFVLHDEVNAGCSPDRLVGDDGLLEIKCPMAATVVDYAINGPPTKYRPQIQGQLWITGRKWCDLLLYHHDIQIVIRQERDEQYILLLEAAVRDFVDAAEQAEKFMREKYFKSPDATAHGGTFDDDIGGF